jgi:hypothetical protein
MCRALMKGKATVPVASVELVPLPWSVPVQTARARRVSPRPVLSFFSLSRLSSRHPFSQSERNSASAPLQLRYRGPPPPPPHTHTHNTKKPVPYIL